MRMVLRGMLLFLFSAAVFALDGHAPVSISGNVARPPVFDATMYSGKPNLQVFGVRPLNLVYAHKFWRDMHDKVAIESLPSEHAVRRAASGIPATQDPVCIDVEHWPLVGTDSVVFDSISKYAQLVDWFKSERPDLAVGLFGIIPVADYYRSRRGRASRAYAEWRSDNDRLKILADRVDVIFPYLYTYYRDERQWVRFAIENLREARRYGKPVYVFLWPQYSEKNESIGYSYIHANFWRLQLETVSPYVDGIVIWGGWDRENKRPAVWDESAAWWRVTKEFVRSGQ